MLSRWPTGRRIPFTTVLCLAVALTVAACPAGPVAASGWLRFARGAGDRAHRARAVAALAIGLIVAKLANYQDPEDEAEFERLVRPLGGAGAREPRRRARRGRVPRARPYDRDDFDTLVREALDDLPDLLIKALDRVPVVVSDKGRQAGAYGLYQGDTVARDNYHDRIIIFRDTLLRDFGHDPDLLRDQVTRTVRHELAHHLGADELGVRELGL